jgi:FeS assembly protein IscX
MLTWDDTFAIALQLAGIFPNVKFEDISLQNIYEWTLQLPDFGDDPVLANDSILTTILREWYEEVNLHDR